MAFRSGETFVCSRIFMMLQHFYKAGMNILIMKKNS